MKKLFLATCLSVVATLSAFAGTPTHTNYKATSFSTVILVEALPPFRFDYVSTCGVTWNCVAYGSTVSQQTAGAYALMDACDAACGSSTTTIVKPVPAA